MKIRRASLKTLLSLFVASFASIGFADGTYDVSPSGDAATDTAAIIAAIGNAADNSVVTLAPGTYKINATIEIAKPVTLRGTGYKTCALDAEKRDFQVVIINNASAAVEGLTIQNGYLNGVFSGSGVTFKAAGRLERCRVTGCVNARFGYSAIYATSGAKVYHCIIDNNANNASGYQGGGAYVSNALFYDCLFFENYSGCAGGGAYAASGNARFVNCTFAYNSVADGKTGGGVSSDGNAVFVNCLAYGNVATSDKTTGGPDFSCSSYGKDKFINCASPKKVNDVSIALTGNPFKDVSADDYRLVSGCDAIDAGSTNSASKVAGMSAVSFDYDLAKAVRVMGDEIDIGAYEYDPNVATVQLEADRTSTTVERGVTLTATVGGTESVGGTFAWTMTPKNGAAAEKATGNPVAFKPLQYGTYDVKVVFTKGSMTPEDEKIGYLFFGPATNYVSAVAVPGSTAPFVDPTMAATNIQDAVDVAADGTVVILMDGTHMLTNGFVVSKGVTLHGSGWDKCTLYGNRTFAEGFPNPMVKLNHAEVALEGVCIANVHAERTWTYGGAAVAITGTGGTLAHCRVSGCTDRYGTAGVRGAVSIAGEAGRVTHCLIDGNSIYKHGANTAGGIYMVGGLVDNTVVRDNTGGLSVGLSLGDNVSCGGAGIVAMGGTVLNCTVISNVCPNTANERSGGIWINNATVRNCIVQGNTVGSADGAVETNLVVSSAATAASVSYSTSPVADLPAGNGNRIGAVAFKTGSVCPKASSIAYRAGSAEGFEVQLLDAVDFYGRPRVTGAGRIDVGCAQNQSAGLVLMFR